MIDIREPRMADAKGVGRAWDDAREYYSDLDPDAFVPPNRSDTELGVAFCERLIEEASKPNRFVAVADRDGEAIGFITASLLEATDTSGRQLMRSEAEQRARIDALVVQRSHWRRGAGRALVEAAERWAHAAGASQVTLNTYAKSPVSVPFYKSLGYEGRGIVFLKPMSDERASE